MCRFMIYKGTPIFLADLITRPEHSIIKQSYAAKERKTSELLPPELNADGFGVGWYLDAAHWNRDKTPCVFTSIQPAWSNRNLSQICDKISSPLIFAHVRAATPGFPVSESDCHPFHFGRYCFMHNGNVAEFGRLRRAFLMALSDELFCVIKGASDSEHIFGVALGYIADYEEELTPQQLLSVLQKTILKVKSICEEHGVKEVSFLNFALTDGSSVVASRVLLNPTGKAMSAASLYFSTGTAFKRYGDGKYRMANRDFQSEVVILASERLTACNEDWIAVPENHLVLITPALNVLVYPLTESICDE